MLGFVASNTTAPETPEVPSAYEIAEEVVDQIAYHLDAQSDQIGALPGDTVAALIEEADARRRSRIALDTSQLAEPPAFPEDEDSDQDDDDSTARTLRRCGPSCGARSVAVVVGERVPDPAHRLGWR